MYVHRYRLILDSAKAYLYLTMLHLFEGPDWDNKNGA